MTERIKLTIKKNMVI